MNVHQRIRAGRLRLNMNEQQFAESVGVTRASVQQWEKDDGTAPNRTRQPLVAAKLGITVAELMADDDTPAEPTHTPLEIKALEQLYLSLAPELREAAITGATQLMIDLLSSRTSSERDVGAQEATPSESHPVAQAVRKTL